MANVRGIFRLNQVYEEQLSGNWAEKTDVFRTQAASFRATHPFGYFAGGDSGGGATQITRISYDNDSANCIFRANCSRTFEHDAAGNETFMYYGGGTYTGVNISKYNYGNDTENMVPAATLSTTRRGVAAVSNTNYTYFAGGEYDKSSVDRIDNSNDTVTAAPNMTVGRHAFAATGNKNYGYFHGGGPSKSDMERIDYSSETFLTPSIGPTGYDTSAHTGFGNADKAYFAYGTTVKGFDYSNDTATFATKGPLLFSVDFYPGATGNSSKGYICGKRISSTTNLNRFDYSNDTTTATAAGNLLYIRNYPAAASPQEHGMTGLTLFPPAFRVDWQHGYYAGGDINPGSTSIVDRVDYSNDLNIASRRGNLSQARYGHAATGNKNYAWNGGGYSPPSYLSNVDRIDYSNDTVAASPKSPLSSNKNTLAAVGNENYGYYAGGYSPSNSPVRISSVDRIDYANDTGTITPKGPLSQPRTSLAGTGTLDYGYFGGGDLPGSSSRVDRIDYSSDTGTAAIKGNLAHPAAYNVGAVGNNNYGYWGGGYSPPSYLSLVSRLDYSNDDAACLTRGFLTANKNNTSGASNSSYGWFGGGYNPATRSDVDRIDFSSDTTNLLARGSLSLPKHSVGGSSAKSNAITTITPLPASSSINFGTSKVSYPYGYWGGGYPPGPIVTVSRIDYSNDTANASPKGPLTSGRYNFAGMMNNSNFGYMGGGYYPSNYTDIHRLDFSNDTITMLVVSNISYYRRRGSHSSIGNKDYGYFTGGSDNASARYSTVDRLDFSNDTATAAPKGPLTEEKSHLVGTSNQNIGYAMGGSPASSIVNRIDFSNDTTIAAVRGPLSSTRYGAGATSNRDFGYIMGGYLPGASSRTERITYANDSVSPVGNLSRTQGYGSAVGNSTYGYVTGGNSNIERLDFSSDTATGLARGQTQLGAASGIFGVSSQSNGLTQPLLANVPTTTVATNFGYFGQGNVKKLDRIDYTNDTATALNRIPNFNYSPSGYRNPTAVSSNYAGYWAPSGGSYQYVSPIFKKVDYSNDTTSTNVAPLVNARGYRGGTGNKDFGYFAGGTPWPSSGKSTNVDRIDYSNDTMPGLERGPLLTAMSQCTAIGNQNFGYFRNHYDGPTNRIDYSNDTQTALAKAATGGYYYDAATGNGDFAYIVASGALVTTTINRFDYSNDTVAGSQRSYLSVVRFNGGATGNKNFGYFSGGGPGPTYKSSIDRLDFSNDTATASPKGLLSGYQYDHAQSPTSAAESNNPQ